MASKLYNYSKDELQQLLDISSSYADLLRKLNMSEFGANRRALKKIIDEYDLDLTKININRKAQNKEDAKKAKLKIIPLEDILKDNRPYNSSMLIKRLFKEGYKERKCENCGIENWLNKEITFQLHHKDGKHNNNEFSNLQVLCPNCHSQTDNFAGKSKSKMAVISKEQEKKPRVIQRGISEDGQRFYDGYGDYKILCPVCQERFMSKNASKCQSCEVKERNIPKISKEEIFKAMEGNTLASAANILGIDRKTVSKWYKYYIDEEKENGNIIINKNIIIESNKAPTREELKDNLYKFKSFVALGRIYGVSDNAIRKWCKKYDLPTHTKEIKAISEEEWQEI